MCPCNFLVQRAPLSILSAPFAPTHVADARDRGSRAKALPGERRAKYLSEEKSLRKRICNASGIHSQNPLGLVSHKGKEIAHTSTSYISKSLLQLNTRIPLHNIVLGAFTSRWPFPETGSGARGFWRKRVAALACDLLVTGALGSG